MVDLDEVFAHLDLREIGDRRPPEALSVAALIWMRLARCSRRAP